MATLIPWRRREMEGNGSRSVGAPVSQLRWDWDRLFDRMLDDFWAPATNAVGQLPIDVHESDEEIRVRAEVPGVDPKNLEVSLSGDVLTLSGQKTDETEEKHGSQTYTERSFGSFHRAVRLPCPVDPEHVDAEHHNGVVTVTLRKSEAVRPKRISVKSSS